MRIYRSSRFEESLLQVRGSNFKVFNKCCGLLFDVEFGRTPVPKRRADGRLPGLVKYELGDGHRVVFQSVDDGLHALFVGKHDDVDRFLDDNRGRRFPGSVEGAPARPIPPVAESGTTRKELPREVNVEPSRTSLFGALTDEQLFAIGVPTSNLADLRDLYDSAEGPLLNVLANLAREKPELAELLLNYAVEPSEGKLKALLAYREPAVRIEQIVGITSEARRDVLPAPRAKAAASERAVRKPRSRSARSGTRTTAKKGAPRKKVSVRAKSPPGGRSSPLPKVRKPRVTSSKSKKATALPRRSAAKSQLPLRLTLPSVKRYLRQKGYWPVDHRDLGGGVWVLAEKRQFAAVAADLERRGVQCKFFPSGTRKRQTRPSWLIDSFKRLPSS